MRGGSSLGLGSPRLLVRQGDRAVLILWASGPILYVVVQGLICARIRGRWVVTRVDICFVMVWGEPGFFWSDL